MFASESASSSGFMVLFVLVVVGIVAYRAYIFFCRPDIWEAEQRVKLMKQEQRARTRNALLTGGLRAILRAWFGRDR